MPRLKGAKKPKKNKAVKHVENLKSESSPSFVYSSRRAARIPAALQRLEILHFGKITITFFMVELYNLDNGFY